jgi:hypothetical protein
MTTRAPIVDFKAPHLSMTAAEHQELARVFTLRTRRRFNGDLQQGIERYLSRYRMSPWDCYQEKLRKAKARRDQRRGGHARPEHCECCGQPHTEAKPLHWDHDHLSGKFRGWLCGHCNSALGFAADSVEILRLLIAYLERTKP